MKQIIFPKIYEVLAKKFINEQNFICNKVCIYPYKNRCEIVTYFNNKKLETIVSRREELFSNEQHCYDIKVDANDCLHYYVDGFEIIDESVLKEKLDYILSLFNQKAIVHMSETFEFDVNHIEVTPELRNLVNDYLGAVINSLGE